MVRSHPKKIEYKVSIDSEVACLWFTKSCVSAASLKLKSQANDIKISLNLIYVAIWHPIDRIWWFNCFWGGLLMIH
jgi:hypothetical protein